MKRILLTIALIAVFAVPASAQLYSLWGDVDGTVCGADNPGTPYFSYNVYVLYEAPTDPEFPGTKTVEYKVWTDLETYNSDPSGYWSTIVPRDEGDPDYINLASGDWVGGDGIAVSYRDCQEGDFWIMYINLTCKLNDAGPPFVTFDHSPAGTWFIGARDSDPFGRTSIAICDEFYSKRSGDVYNWYGYNQGCTISTKETSWGAIKSMY